MAGPAQSDLVPRAPGERWQGLGCAGIAALSRLQAEASALQVKGEAARTREFARGPRARDRTVP